MIDRDSRDKLAESLRHLVSGTMKNLDFDDLDFDGTTGSSDPAIFAIFHQSWHFYDDFHNHSIELTDGTRRDVARWIMFLYSDFEFEWMSGPSAFWAPIISIWRRIVRAPDLPKGDLRYWPFFRKEDYQQSLTRPRLLTK
jgi:hypothetical protein